MRERKKSLVGIWPWEWWRAPWSFILTRVMKFSRWYLYQILFATREGILQCIMKWSLWFFIQTCTESDTATDKRFDMWVMTDEWVWGLRSHGLDSLQLDQFLVLRGLWDFGATAEFSWKVTVGSCFCITASLNNFRILEFPRLLDLLAFIEICGWRAKFPLTEKYI